MDELLLIIRGILVDMDDEEEPCPPIDECPNKEQLENDDCKKCWANYILAKARPIIEKQERERIYKELTSKCKLHYPSDVNRSNYMKPQIVIDEQDYLQALKDEE